VSAGPVAATCEWPERLGLPVPRGSAHCCGRYRTSWGVLARAGRTIPGSISILELTSRCTRHRVFHMRPLKQGVLFLLVSLVLGAAVSTGSSQGTFVNLDFEHPILPLLQGQALASRALPGWTSYDAGNPSSWVYCNDRTLCAAAVTLQGPGSADSKLQGQYSVTVGGACEGGYTAAIGQTGQIPASAQALLFLCDLYESHLQVTFAGQPISVFTMARAADYRIVAGDISGFAGQTGELRFTALPNDGAMLDDIQFSPVPIPEPTVSDLAALGAAALAWRFARRRLRRC
jgi:hypothetical protein